MIVTDLKQNIYFFIINLKKKQFLLGHNSQSTYSEQIDNFANLNRYGIFLLSVTLVISTSGTENQYPRYILPCYFGYRPED